MATIHFERLDSGHRRSGAGGGPWGCSANDDLDSWCPATTLVVATAGEYEAVRAACDNEHHAALVVAMVTSDAENGGPP